MEYIGNRISIKHKENELSIIVLSQRDKTKNIMLSLWLLLWTIGGIIIFLEYFILTDANTKLAIVVWLGFWGYFEFKIFKALLWRKSGIEKIKLRDNKLFYKRDTSGRGKIKVFEFDFIKDLRLTEQKEKGFFESLNNSYWVIAREKISFDYYGKEIKIAIQLDDAEAKQLLKLLKKEFSNHS